MTIMQLDLDMLQASPAKPRDLLTAALAWIDEHPVTWQACIVEPAIADAQRSGRVRVKRYIEDMRGVSRAKVPNAYSAPFGRILAAWHPDIAHCVPLSVSKVDGMTIPPRPRP